MDSQILIYHILVKYEYEAQDVFKKIKQGLSFNEAAQKFSICSSSKQGGFLGPFKPRRFVDAFSEAVEELKTDEVSNPVRTQFGYHLILKKNN